MTSFFIGDMKLSLSSGFLLLLAWLNFLDQDSILPWGILACVFHEMGHCFAIYICGEKVKTLSLSVVGAEIPLPSHLSYSQEFFCAVAGAMTNLLVAFGVHLFFGDSVQSTLFIGLNIALALLNLLPISKLDGGRALACVLHLWLPFWGVEVVTFCLDLCFALFLLLLGLWVCYEGGSITLLFLGGWLFLVFVGANILDK